MLKSCREKEYKMGFKKQDKIKVLETMRLKHQQFTENVQRAMGQISDEDLTCEEHIKTYAKRLYILKKLNKLTYSQIGNQLHVSHTTIENIMTRTLGVNSENKDNISAKYHKIDKIFLEIFSLFFEVSPLYLIGKECKVDAPPRYYDNGKLIETKPSTYSALYDLSGKLEPLVMIKDDILTAIHSIIYNLFPTAMGRDLLIDFIKLCDAYESLQATVKKQFIETPYFKKIFSYAVIKIDDEQWRVFLDENLQYRATIAGCVSILNRLGEQDYEFLKLFANISKLAYNDKVKNASCEIKSIHDWLKISGFLQDNRLFCGNYTIEKSCNNYFKIDFPIEYTFQAKTKEEIEKIRNILISNIGLDYT